MHWATFVSVQIPLRVSLHAVLTGMVVVGRRGRGARPDAAEHIKVPTTDFDFQSSNAKFDKAALSLEPGGVKGTSPAASTVDEGSESEPKDQEASAEKEKEKAAAAAYNPQKSFFDPLPSSAATPPLLWGRAL